jgi:hypothetical protein
MRSPRSTSRAIAALAITVTLATLTSCASVAPSASGPHADPSRTSPASGPHPASIRAAIRPAPAVPGPPPGTHAQAAALARLVLANNAGCPGAGITVNGQQQPLLTDDGAEVAALAGQQVTVTSPP